MRVLAMPADKTGCGFYRIQEPCRVLKEYGDFHIDVDDPDKKQSITKAGRSPLNNRITSIGALDYDVVVMQMPSRQDALDGIPLMQEQGIAVVAEFDDDYWAMDKGHFMRGEENNRYMMKACAMADLVTVTTPALARKIASATDTTVRVLRNCIPKSYLSVDGMKHEETVVGWSGNPHTHPGDLEVTRGAVARACRANGAKFYTVGGELAVTLLGFEDREALNQGWVPLDLYPSALKYMDIGIIPLKNNEFNESKSYLKGLEYASLGIPFVASPSPEYKMLAHEGIGCIATTGPDWYRKLTHMMTSDFYREGLIGRGLEFAVRNTYEHRAWEWAEAWAKAIEIRKST